MRHSFVSKSLIAVSLGLTLFTSVQAQPMPDGPMDHPPHAGQWHEKMMQHWQAHQKALHDKLKLSADQEGAWQSFVQSHQPPAKAPHEHPKWDELASLTTPQRLQKMNEWQAEHQQQMQAHMKQHQEAVLAFYSQLTPEQQKVFDAETLPKHREHARGNKQH